MATPSEPIATHRAGSKLLRSYVGKVGRWARSITRQYALGVGILVTGVLFLLVAAGFGVAAIFHFLTLRYGVNIAFAVVGGFFLILGLIGLISGMGLMKRALPPVPRPSSELDALKRTAVLDLVTKTNQVKQRARDHSTPLLLGAACVVAFGWLAGSRRARTRQ